LTHRARQAAAVREGKGKVGRRARAGRRLGLQAERKGEMGLRFFLFFQTFFKTFSNFKFFSNLKHYKPFSKHFKNF
jgi:hypothetical protein